MKVTGREITEYEREQAGEILTPAFLTLGEVDIEAGPKGLRKLAKFLNEIARYMEKGGSQDHFHFNSNINDRPQIVIISKKAAKQWRRERRERQQEEPVDALTTAREKFDKLAGEIRDAQNRGEDVDIGTHVIAGELARNVVNLEREAEKHGG